LRSPVEGSPRKFNGDWDNLLGNARFADAAARGDFESADTIGGAQLAVGAQGKAAVVPGFVFLCVGCV